MASTFPIIKKTHIDQMKVAPNLDYEKVREGFRWEETDKAEALRASAGL